MLVFGNLSNCPYTVAWCVDWQTESRRLARTRCGKFYFARVGDFLCFVETNYYEISYQELTLATLCLWTKHQHIKHGNVSKFPFFTSYSEDCAFYFAGFSFLRVSALVDRRQAAYIEPRKISIKTRQARVLIHTETQGGWLLWYVHSKIKTAVINHFKIYNSVKNEMENFSKLSPSLILIFWCCCGCCCLFSSTDLSLYAYTHRGFYNDRAEVQIWIFFNP